MEKIPDVMKIANNAHKLIMENEKVRVMEITLKPGEKSLMHNHPHDNVLYAISDAKTKVTFPDGKSNELDLKAGQAQMMPSQSHEATNIGNTVVRLLLVELK